ncbi:MAG: penicillin-binding protein 2, partial [Symbiobacteriaceae bacterium]|nr:penicillin-binding protein 2 [Symbiobacteriaceae bacterium]
MKGGEWAMHGRQTGRRVFTLSVILLLGLAALATKMAQLQGRQHTAFLAAAAAQRFHEVRHDAPRGEILDRHGRKLVTNRTAYRLHLLYPAYVQGNVPNQALLGQLANLLEVDQATLEERAWERIRDRRFFEPILIKDDLSVREVSLLMELRATLPGVYIDTHPVRYYPYGELLAHVLGHTGEVVSDEEAGQLGRGYIPGDFVGRAGVELQYDQVLQGARGYSDLEIDALFRPTGESTLVQPAVSGRNLQLTIDLDLQKTVEDALLRTLNHVSETPDWAGIYFPKTNAGAAVVMDVRTGAILAMASYPTFNPNTPAVVPESKAEAPFLNRAIGSAYLPGSTWKMLTGAAALEAGVVSPYEEVLCTGTYDKLEHKLDWKLDGHGWQNITEALANSCNIYFYEMGYRLGVERLAEVAQEFGFGFPLGVDLPGEAPGWIPDAPRRNEDLDPGSWNGGKLLSAAIGQGPTATPLQLARYAAVIANGGALVRPHIGAAIVTADGQVASDLTPAPDGRVGLQESSFHFLMDGMEAVTDWGTSAGAFKGLPFKVAGKTGTAEVVGTQNCQGDPACQFGVYVAYAPADEPEIAVAVVGERAGHGDSMNPVVRAAMAAYFQVKLAANDPLYVQGILPRPEGLAEVPPAPAPEPPAYRPAVPNPAPGPDPQPPPPNPAPGPDPQPPPPNPAPGPDPQPPPPNPAPGPDPQ